ncbi:iron chelate uptake ABC transporter family permease subunit [Clostridioides difficile]|uniref:ABC transporter permease n=1 Tax=Clostridioides difficile TaxID=1496 RepID=UPI0003B286CA|nr:iron chelate uptake ABC transporter family permease subunit [Clostridioides difficile]MBY2512564.1 iron chelate uptake ABC transporter family permease subunit [Clostridioides difficile]MCD8636055.1 iron chelate uptake ABC transporter family permease subunit [Clostridioides difficile]MCE4707419.1 iron chelate uptake ABC transporter family permease subunit [Clostridioides difficile]MCE4724269.1 iron chelate uptake ABC transporter family permease subunit [Clostridioides difficile]MCI2276416.1 
MKKRYLVIGIIILSYFSLFIGAEDINIMHIFVKNQHKLMIFIMSRIPRLISRLIAGVGMSIAGLIMQQISKNKFVSPTTGATIDAAQFGIVICMLLVPTASIFTKTIIAFVFSLVGTFTFMKIIGKLQFKNIIFVPLVGIMFGNIIGSMTDFIAYKYDLSQNVSSWMQGDFSMILKGNYEILYITIPLIILAYIYANKFTIVGMGMDFATNLGLSYKRIVNIGLIIVALVTVCVVVTAGNIPFIGLIVPNIVSLYMGDNIRASIWYTGLLGAIFVLICDIFGRIIIYPYEISIGLTVGVIGSILFLYLILRRNVNEA